MVERLLIIDGATLPILTTFELVFPLFLAQLLTVVGIHSEVNAWLDNNSDQMVKSINKSYNPPDLL